MSLDDSTPRGRPTAFRNEFIDRARELAARGATDTEIGESIGVDAQTIDRWKEQRPEFRQALEESRAGSDACGPESVSRLADGFSRRAKEVLSAAAFARPQPVTFGTGHGPHTTTMVAWLELRRPAPSFESSPAARTGKDDKPAEIKQVDRSPEAILDLARRIAFILEGAARAKQHGTTSGSFTPLVSSATSTGVS